MRHSVEPNSPPNWLGAMVKDLFSFIALCGFLAAITVWALVFVGKL